MAKILPISVSDQYVEEVKAKSRKVLGRDLTQVELRYLGISSTASSEKALEVHVEDTRKIA